MPRSIQTNATIKAVLKHEKNLVPISGYVANTNQNITTIYPALDTTEWFEVPTNSVLHTEVGSNGVQTLFVDATAKVQVVRIYDAKFVRDMQISAPFQDFDQKANQLYNLLSSVMKAMNEMRMGTVRNML